MGVRLNPSGLAEYLRSPAMRSQLQTKLDQVEANVNAQGIKVGDRDGGPDEVPIPVETGVFDQGTRIEGLVTLAHPAGQAVQAKDGALTRAAAEAGLQVRGGR